jgi:PAS domain S-box-containing protein
VARVDHEDVLPLSSSSGEAGRVTKWKRATRYTALLHEAGYLSLGLVSLATVTGLYFWLNVPLVTAAFTYLLVLVLLSLLGSLSSLVVLSFIAVCFLNYFFAPPIYSFRIDYAQDLITISAFLVTSFVVNFLVTRARVERRNHMRAQEALRQSEGSARSALDGMRESEARLADAQRELQQMIDTIPILVVRYSSDARRDFVNAAWKQYTGVSDEAALGTDWSIVAHPDDLAIGEKMWRDTLAKGEPVHTEVRLRRADGQYRWFAVDRVALRGENGKVITWYGTAYDIEDRKRAEEALRSALDGIAGLIVVLAPNGEVETVNRQTLEYFGRTLEYSKNWATNDALHPEDLPRTLEAFERAIVAGIPFNYELRLRRSDGQYRWFDTRHVPIRDDAGDIARWYILATDIEDRKRAEHASRSAIDGIDGLVAILAPNGELEAVNRPLFEYFGRSHEWLRNWGTNDAVHPEDLPRVLELFKRGMASGSPFNFELRMRRSDGEYRWFDNRVRPIRDDSGGILRWYDLLTDIEDRKRAEHASRSAIDAIAGLVAILAPNGEVETVNRPLLDYFGRSLEELKNWGTSDAVHPEDLPRVLELNTRGLASGLPFNFELRLRRFDGEYRWFDTRVVPIRDDSGRIERWYNLLLDVEDRTRALAQLEQMRSDFAHMNRVSMMGELAASITHEVNQPITAAVTYALAARRFLSTDPPNFREVDDALSLIVKEGNRAGEVVERVRALVKKVPTRKDAVALDDAVLEVVALTRAEAANNSVAVRTKFAEGLPRVQGDRVQLQQVMLNLIVNAIQAMNANGEHARELVISVDAVPSEGGVRVGVRDTGPGLNPESLPRLFEPFYTTKPEGMGMGLSICRSIIEAHDGRLWASGCEPRGAVVQFTIPAA